MPPSLEDAGIHRTLARVDDELTTPLLATMTNTATRVHHDVLTRDHHAVVFPCHATRLAQVGIAIAVGNIPPPSRLDIW